MLLSDLGVAGTLTLMLVRLAPGLSSCLGRCSQCSVSGAGLTLSLVTLAGLVTLSLVTLAGLVSLSVLLEGILMTLTGLCLPMASPGPLWGQQSQRRAKSSLVLMMQGMTRR